MASIDVGVHPYPDKIGVRHFREGRDRFSTLDVHTPDDSKVSVFVGDREVLDALQAALDAIRADMDAAGAVEADEGQFGDPAIVGTNGHPEYREPEAVAS